MGKNQFEYIVNATIEKLCHDFPGLLPTRSISSQRIVNEPNKSKKGAFPSVFEHVQKAEQTLLQHFVERGTNTVALLKSFKLTPTKFLVNKKKMFDFFCRI